MARTPYDAFQGSENSSDTKIETISAESQDIINIPGQDFLANAEMTRDGQDLILEVPDGFTLVIEGYFLAEPAPVIEAADGSVLTPDLVNAFARSPAQFAQTGSMDDQSPVGAVEELSGNATVTRADGTQETITIGTPIYQGDIIETDSQGAVNVVFIDETSMAVSENARMAVDEYTFDPSTESGTTNFSVLRGVFVFTSGLIGRDDPDDVQIDTPVGSIGIRGTVIAGKIQPGGDSEITVIEGAIVVRNGQSEKTLSLQFESVKLGGFNDNIQDLGVLNASDVGTKFSSVSNVVPTLFSSINDAAAEQDNATSENERAAENDVEATSENAEEGSEEGNNSEETPPNDGQPSENAGEQDNNPGENANAPNEDASPENNPDTAQGENPDQRSGENAAQAGEGDPQQGEPGTSADNNAQEGPAGNGPIDPASDPFGTGVDQGFGPNNNQAGQGPNNAGAQGNNANGPGGSTGTNANPPAGSGSNNNEPNNGNNGNNNPSQPVNFIDFEIRLIDRDVPDDANPGFVVAEIVANQPLPNIQFRFNNGTDISDDGWFRITQISSDRAVVTLTGAGSVAVQNDIQDVYNFDIVGLFNGQVEQLSYAFETIEVVAPPVGDGLIDLAGSDYLNDGFTRISDNIGNKIGHSITALGDVNNDGFADFAFSNDTSALGQNHSYIVYGGPGQIPSDLVPGLVDPLINSVNDPDAGFREIGILGNPDESNSQIGSGDLTILTSETDTLLNLAEDIFIEGDTAYIVGTTGLSVIDITDPNAFGPVTSLVGVALDTVWSDGTYVYVSNGLTIDAYDTTGMYINTINVSLGGTVEAITGDGTYIFIAEQNAGIRALTFDGVNFTDEGTFDTTSLAMDIVVDDTTGNIFVADGTEFLSFTFDGTSFSQQGSVSIASDQVVVSGDYAYVMDTANDSVEIIDISDPTSMTIVASYSSAGVVGIQSIDVDGDYLYISFDDTNDGIEVVNISNPASPTLADTIPSGLIGARGLQVVNGKIYLVSTDGTNGTLTSIDNGLQPFAGILDRATIAGIGDFNGDGVEDYVLGLPGEDDTESEPNSGTAFIVSGANPNDYIELDGQLTADRVGESVTGIGDINNDGYADVLINAPGTSGDSGEAYVLFGGPAALPGNIDISITLSGSVGATLGGANTGELFGANIAGIGDFNGDGLDDFAIAGTGFGFVNIYYGNTSNVYSAADLTFTNFNTYVPPGDNDLPIINMGDLNGDGLSDILMGSPGTDEAFIVFGGTGGGGNITTTNDIRIDIAGGSALASGGAAGDWNGDGYDDGVFVVTNGTDSNIYVIYGGASLPGTIDLAYLDNSDNAFKMKYTGVNGSDLSIDALGDVDGDGFDDFGIGNPNAYSGDGEVLVVYGREAGDVDYVSNAGTVSATSDGEALIGRAGNDTFIDNGNNDLSMRGGAGNDTFLISNSNFLGIDGGGGFDMISTGSIDFSGFDGESITGIEEIVDGAGGPTTIRLTLENIFDMLKSSNASGIPGFDKELKLSGDAGTTYEIDINGNGTDDFAGAYSAANLVAEINAANPTSGAAVEGTPPPGFDQINIGGYTLLIENGTNVNIM